MRERGREKERGHGGVRVTVSLSPFDLQMASLCHQFRAQGRAITVMRGPKERTAPRCYRTALLIIQQWEKRCQIGLISLYIKQESRYKDRRGGLWKWTDRTASILSLSSVLVLIYLFHLFFVEHPKFGRRSNVISSLMIK